MIKIKVKLNVDFGDYGYLACMYVEISTDISKVGTLLHENW